MSNHFTGLKLGPPEGDTRLDLTDLYAFQSPTDARADRNHPQLQFLRRGSGVSSRGGVPDQYR